MRSTRSITAAALSAVALLLFWFGCADNTLVTDLPDDVGIAGESSREAVRANKARSRADDDLLKQEGVEGVGTRIMPDGSTSIVVYLRTENAATTANIPDRIDGVPVTTVVTGVFRAYADETSRQRPAPIGFSVGHPDITAGTIGARVTDGENLFVLSNNHVLANSNDALKGDNTLQPGPYDGGVNPDDAIGTLYDYEPIDFSGGNNTIDAAITVTTTADVDYKTPSDEGYGTPGTTVTDAFVGQLVQKYGRTTGHTKGEVAETNVTVNVCYECANPSCFQCSKLATFVDQIGITPGEFSDGGDSGSLIVTDDGSNNPVGLLFAGSSSRTLANPISAVLSRFNVSIDNGSSSGGGTTNSPPTASFTYTVTDLTVDFTDTSTDSDGTVSSWDWEFGDGSTSTAQNPSHTYASDGTYTVTLTVTDDDGATDSASQDVTVSSSSSSGISLSASGRKVRGRHHIDLAWSGASSTNVDVYRNGSLIDTIPNDGAYTDATNNVGGGTYIHEVCEAGTSTCSNETTTTF